MSALNKLSDSVRESLDVLAEGWQDLWNRARNAITRFTPASEDENVPGNRWGLLSAELHEAGDHVTVSVEAPGLNKEDFEIFIDGQYLFVRGTKQSSTERSEGHYHITERAYGRFERVFGLPVEVDDSGTTASYKQGVLTIRLPKSARHQRRIVEVG